MDHDTIIRKLTSRKLWVSVCSFVSLLVVALGHTEGEASTVTALIMAGASVVAYIVAEGLVDGSNKHQTDPGTAGGDADADATEPAE